MREHEKTPKFPPTYSFLRQEVSMGNAGWQGTRTSPVFAMPWRLKDNLHGLQWPQFGP
jgi:hypothetical protein